MRALRTLLAVLAPAAVAMVLWASPAAAQTTTTSSVPSLPVTGSGPTTTTTAPAAGGASNGEAGQGSDLATTGIDADVLFKLGIALVLIGAVVQLGERGTRAPEPKLTLG